MKDLPDGSKCFLDANIFYYHIVGTPILSDECSDLLVRVARGTIIGLTSTVAVAEATHKTMLTEIARTHGVPPKGLIARIKKHPELLDQITEHHQVVELIEALQIAVEPITISLLRRAAIISRNCRLLTNDSLSLAVMEKLRVTHIATNDDDFDSVDWVTVSKPTK